MWFITQCFGVGFRGRAGVSVPLPGPPDPPDMAPDPHDEGDVEGPDTRSLMDEFMAKMAQSVNDDYKNLLLTCMHCLQHFQIQVSIQGLISCFLGLFMYGR